MRIEKNYFYAEDGLELFGLLHTSEDKNEKEVVIATHGMGSNCFKKRDDIIAQNLTANNISYFTYNNRGYGLVNEINRGKEKILQGTVFEDVYESYLDIIAAIKLMISKGYTRIHLQGHSLGSTKTLYTYNKLVEDNNEEILKYIGSVILLSLVDLSDVMKYVDECNRDVDVPRIAYEKEEEGQLDYIIETKTSFMSLVSAKTFLRYYRDNEKVDFAKYTTDEYSFEIINRIAVPLFMRWGNVNELINLSADDLSALLMKKINNPSKDIGFIDGATHNYRGKEQILANEILDFIKNKIPNIDNQI